MMAPLVEIFDEQGMVCSGFKNGKDDWEKYAMERARELSYATGKKIWLREEMNNAGNLTGC
jgi:hypothetical protein